MSKLYEYTDHLPTFSEPRYDIAKEYSVVFLDCNKNITYLDGTLPGYKIFECPLLKDLNDSEIEAFKKHVKQNHKFEAIVLVNAGTRGLGIFSIFKGTKQ